MWIVAGDLAYYPWVQEFATYEAAKAYYDKEVETGQTIYLAEVKEHKNMPE